MPIGPEFFSFSETMRVIPFERVPRNAILDVHANADASGFLSQKYSTTLLSPDTLADWTVLTLPPLPHIPDAYALRKLHTFSEEGRKIPVAQGIIPYGDGIIGSQITAKGTNISGDRYEKAIHKTDTTTMIDPATPWGFFGSSSAEFDMLCSNQLIAGGFRAPLPLGIIYLDARVIRDHLYNRWAPYSSKLATKIVEHIDVISDNNDTLAQYIRLSGTRSYITSLFARNPITRLIKDTELHHEISRAGQLFSYALEGEEFSSLFYKQDIPIHLAKQFAEGLTYPNKQIDSTVCSTVMAALLAHQADTFTTVVKHQPHLFMNNLGTILDQSNSRDTDLTFISGDFEEQPSESIPYDETAVRTSVGLWAYNMAQDYMNLLTSAKRIHHPALEQFNEMFNVLFE